MAEGQCTVAPDKGDVTLVNHGAVFIGPATEITLNQAGIQNATAGKPGPNQVQAVVRKANEALKKVYTDTGSYVQMLPWVDDDKKHIMDIYTKLRLVKRVDTKGTSPYQVYKERFSETLRLSEEMFQSETRMKSYEEIFHLKTREENPIKRVVISGLAGIGKTTLIDKIAYDWALGDSETLNKYELAFVLKMRSLKQTSDLVGAIFDQLLDKDVVEQSALKEFIDKNQDKVLILYDGFDEFKTMLDTSSFGSILKVLNRKQGTECCVFITSRPPLNKLVNSSLVTKPFTHVTVEGFSFADVKEYVNKFFREDDDKASNLIEQIELSDTWSDLAKSPMLLLLMCLLWEADKTLPDTMTRLYIKALKYIFKRKTADIKDDVISKILISIGKVALDRLISTDKSFAFREGDFEKSALDAAIDAGVLTSERVFDGFDTYQLVFFMHHTFLEYCAAMYWQSMINTEEFNRVLDQTHTGLTDTVLRHRRSSHRPHFRQHDVELNDEGYMMRHPHSSRSSCYEYMFRFCCGDNEACTHRILQKVQKYKEHALLCYFESQSKELPQKEVICSVLSDTIVFPCDDNESKNTLLYFLKCVTALGRGNDYFTEVKKLEWKYFNFQRFGKDLMEWIKLMTNLKYLNLECSSLTTANINKILSSLATPTTLTRLDLSGINTLGGSVALLAPQLKKLKCLKDLLLDSTSLEAEDVSPIAESMCDTLVYLNVRWNALLGGSASIWGPQLGKMECLQDIDLKDCSLKVKDIEPIAMALSGVSTLVNLNLSMNPDLGGHAKMWALHLERLRHLKEVKLRACSLRDKDVGPIAVALSDKSTLVTLDLSWNRDLGGCAEKWALHLKRMRHLKEVDFSDCSLIDKDVEPIALALSDIQTLVHLNLYNNKALGGSASLWALHLKTLNQLKELTLDWCNLTGGDMEPIAESVSEMPTLMHLNLDYNKPLIGCAASSWAHHLKQMTKYLQKLKIYGLTDEDKEYVNASIVLKSPILDI